MYVPGYNLESKIRTKKGSWRDHFLYIFRARCSVTEQDAVLWKVLKEMSHDPTAFTGVQKQTVREAEQ